ncbi:hypothetical protein MXB_2445, partial [Myxobolus squamalis]
DVYRNFLISKTFKIVFKQAQISLHLNFLIFFLEKSEFFVNQNVFGPRNIQSRNVNKCSK